MKIGDSFVVSIKEERLHNYSLDGVQNNDVGVMTHEESEEEGWCDIKRKDGTTCKNFLIYFRDASAIPSETFALLQILAASEEDVREGRVMDKLSLLERIKARIKQ